MESRLTQVDLGANQHLATEVIGSSDKRSSKLERLEISFRISEKSCQIDRLRLDPLLSRCVQHPSLLEPVELPETKTDEHGDGDEDEHRCDNPLWLPEHLEHSGG